MLHQLQEAGRYSLFDGPKYVSAKSVSDIDFEVIFNTLIVIDANVDDYQSLIDDLPRDVAIALLSADADGVNQITRLLTTLGTIRTLHIVSHGAPGCLTLGNSELSLETLSRYAPELKQWFSASTDAVLTLYGCQVAAGDAGAEFVHALHQLTQANIAASISKTGHPVLGGNWDLEYSLGSIEGRPLFSQTLRDRYQGVFPTPVTTLSTTTQAGTPTVINSAAVPQPTVTNIFPAGNYTTNFGQGNDLLLNGFTVGGQSFDQFTGATTALVIRRNDNAAFSNADPNSAVEVNTPFFDATLTKAQIQGAIATGSTTIDVNTSIALTNEEALNGNIINRGVETVFFNSGSTGSTNERLDYLFSQPLEIPEGANVNELNGVGFLFLERGSSDAKFQIAPITAVDPNTGTPTAFGDLVFVAGGNSNYGRTGLSLNAYQAQQVEGVDPTLRPANHFGNQPIDATFISWQELGIEVGQDVFGYALFDTNTILADPDGADGNPELVDWTNRTFFPDGNDSSIDLLAGGIVFQSGNFVQPANAVIPGADTDGDGIPDVDDLDDDNDGILDVTEERGVSGRDTDGDGIPDIRDLDADNDGILDVVEAGHTQQDPDGDGRLNGPFGQNGFADALETPSESGIANYTIADTDNEGVPDFQDLDADNDGLLDVTEGGGSDPDQDGVIGTGIPVVNANGIANDINPTVGGTPSPVPDSDNDGTADFRDLDSDNNGTPDLVQSAIDAPDTNGDGVIDGPDGDGDGIIDAVDRKPGQFGTAPNANPNNGNQDSNDFDGDGIIDADDLDDDNDGILDSVEERGVPGRDTDGDGVPDIRDLDADNDGILDVIEAGHAEQDVDGDGRLDGPFGNNGFADALETSPESGQAIYIVADIDNEGVPDFQDLDSDNDSILDVTEGGGSDPDQDGIIGIGTPVVNRDGVANIINPAVGGSPLPVPDTDGDSKADFRDVDSDNDGINDLTERGGVTADATSEGVVIGVDTDNDGIIDTIDGDVGRFGTNPLNNPVPIDSHGDNRPDYREIPSIVGGSGNDVLLGFSDSDTLIGAGGNDVISGGSSADLLRGGAGDDIINGGSNADRIRGGSGNDVINGGTGNDIIRGNRGDDAMNGGAGRDRLFGGLGRDRINGGSGRDRIQGGAGVDTISGDRGNDRIDGGAGMDILTGGQGRDVFVFRSIQHIGDTITDFELLKDQINLRGLNNGVESFSDLRIVQDGNDTLVNTASGQRIVRLNNTEASDLDASRFRF